jgi:hypothetical protein
VSDPPPPSAALPLVRGRRERSERGGGSHAISNWGCNAAVATVFRAAETDFAKQTNFFVNGDTRNTKNSGLKFD